MSNAPTMHHGDPPSFVESVMMGIGNLLSYSRTNHGYSDHVVLQAQVRFRQDSLIVDFIFIELIYLLIT